MYAQAVPVGRVLPMTPLESAILYSQYRYPSELRHRLDREYRTLLPETRRLLAGETAAPTSAADQPSSLGSMQVMGRYDAATSYPPAPAPQSSPQPSVTTNPRQKGLRHAVLMTGAKEGLKIGLTVGASLIGGVLLGPAGAVLAGALMSGALSALDQYLTHGRVDWGQVALEGVIGGISGGVGGVTARIGIGVAKKLGFRVVQQAAGREIPRRLTVRAVGNALRRQTVSNLREHVELMLTGEGARRVMGRVLSGAVNGGTRGGFMGYVGGGARSAYQDWRTTAQIDWQKAHQRAKAGVKPGIIAGATAGTLTAKLIDWFNAAHPAPSRA